MIPTINNLLRQLDAIEQQSADSTLVFYEPGDAQASFYQDLCRAYLTASDIQRRQVCAAVKDYAGIINNLLGYVYASARQLGETKDRDWLDTGLAAAAIRGDGPDFRDFYLALAELYAAALEAGIEPDRAFTAIGGGVPADFTNCAVLKARLADMKHK